MPVRPSIAVIGAGIAGLAAARRLADVGARVVVFDKSAGVGGRMATRRTAEVSFDHGAQFFTARRTPFTALVEALQDAGEVAVWDGRWCRQSADGLEPEPVGETRMVGLGGMPAVARALTHGLTLELSRPVVGLVRRERGGGWWIRDAEDAQAGPFDAVAVAIPAPQAVPLLNGWVGLTNRVGNVRYAPCWAGMVMFDRSLDLPADGVAMTDPVLGWVARNASKPGRVGLPEAWVLHATPAWSRQHLEDDAETVAALLASRFRELFALPTPSRPAIAHRWRYALVEQGAGVTCLWDPELRLGACGDWCVGPRIEVAYESGLGLGETIAAALNLEG